MILAACAFGIFVVAATAQAVSGFGGAMLAIPLLLLLVDPATAVLAASAVGLALSGMAWRKERAHVVQPVARRLWIAGIIGMPAGLAVLLLVEARTLQFIIGVLILLTVAVLAARVQIRSSLGLQWGAGVLSGAMLTSTGMNGPPLVLVLGAAGVSARNVRATLQAVFTVQDVVAVALLALAGVVSRDALIVTGAGLVGVRIGWVVGDRIFHALSEEVFRRVVLVGLTGAAVTCLMHALAG